MSNPRPLTFPQRGALQWMQTNARDPAFRLRGYPHMTSADGYSITTARALAANGLATIEAEGNRWLANLTDKGLRAELRPEGRGWVVMEPEATPAENGLGHMQGRGAS